MKLCKHERKLFQAFDLDLISMVFTFVSDMIKENMSLSDTATCLPSTYALHFI